VVIPLYNKAPYIIRTLRSVLAQSYQFFEVVVVDDGSTDGGGDIVLSVGDPRIRLIRQENGGVSAARNRGIQEAKAELIAFLDADDEWKPNFLNLVLEMYNTYPEAGLYGTYYEFNGADTNIKRPIIKLPPDFRYGLLPNYFSAALGQPPICSSAVAVPRKVFEHVGGFKVGENIGEDLDMWGRIALYYRVAYTTEIGAVYHLGFSTIGTRSHNKQLPFVDHVFSLLSKPEDRILLSHEVLKYVACLQIGCARQLIVEGRNRDLARQMLNSCFKIRQLSPSLFWWYFWLLMPRPLVTFASGVKHRLNDAVRNN